MSSITVSNTEVTVTVTDSGVSLTVEQGQPGVGVPAGGSVGQVLGKTGAGDYATGWVSPSAIPDGDKGDITVSNSGATWTIDNQVVSKAKLAWDQYDEANSLQVIRTQYMDGTAAGSFCKSLSAGAQINKGIITYTTEAAMTTTASTANSRAAIRDTDPDGFGTINATITVGTYPLYWRAIARYTGAGNSNQWANLGFFATHANDNQTLVAFSCNGSSTWRCVVRRNYADDFNADSGISVSSNADLEILVDPVTNGILWKANGVTVQSFAWTTAPGLAYGGAEIRQRVSDASPPTLYVQRMALRQYMVGTMATQYANAVAITGGSATGLSTVGTDLIDFNTAATPTPALGRTYWDAAYSTLALGIDADVSLKIGQGLFKIARNTSGATINKGQPVYVSGSHAGSQLIVGLASAASEATSADTVGVAAESIANNASGFVQTFGYLEGVTTNGYAGAEGSALYVSSTAGTLQSGLPTQPLHGVRIGFLVKKAGGGAGAIFVNVQNYQELDELSNVLSSGEASYDLLSYDATAGVWRNRTIANAFPTASIPSSALSAPGSNSQVMFKSGGALTGSSKFRWLDGTSELILNDGTNAATFSPLALTATSGYGIDTAGAVLLLGDINGSSGGTLVTIDDATGVVSVAATLDIGANTLMCGGISLANGEFLSNAVNGQVEIGPNGTTASDYSMVVDGTSWGFGVKLFTKNRSTGNTSDSFWFASPVMTGYGVPFKLGTDSAFLLQAFDANTLRGTELGLRRTGVYNGAFAIMDDSALGFATRRPPAAPSNPWFYAYAGGTANAGDYVRVGHNGTNGIVEAGRGPLNLVTPSGSTVNINGSAAATQSYARRMAAAL